MLSNVGKDICSFYNLYRAMLLCKRGVIWKDSVAGYVVNGLVRIHSLKKSLEKGTYKISPYANFKVYEPKERDILSTKMKDRVFQRSFVDNYFYDEMTKVDVDRSYESFKANITNNGKHKSEHPGKRARRNCHGLELAMDAFYKDLWRDDECSDLRRSSIS